jgi:FtsZ-binding cell division protein ZapB
LSKKNRDAGQMSIAGTEEGEILSRLSERVEKAVQTIQELRRERDSLKGRLDLADAKLREHAEAAERAATLEEDNERFKKERGAIRDRIETILSSLEALEQAGDEVISRTSDQ